MCTYISSFIESVISSLISSLCWEDFLSEINETSHFFHLSDEVCVAYFCDSCEPVIWNCAHNNGIQRLDSRCVYALRFGLRFGTESRFNYFC